MSHLEERVSVVEKIYSISDKPLVGVIMGSTSDLPTMQEAINILEKLEISYEARVVSAHRTPDLMFEYAQFARERGIKVIIAGAGGSAHLPGMVASITTLPVIGVPVQTKALSGVDSLYSIVQMPPGIPVATVAINGAKNAGILAASILSLQSEEISKKLSDYKKELNNIVNEKINKLNEVGYEAYLRDIL